MNASAYFLRGACSGNMSGMNIRHVASTKGRPQPFSPETDVDWPRRQPYGNPLLMNTPALGVGQAPPARTLGITAPSTQLGQGAHDSGPALPRHLTWIPGTPGSTGKTTSGGPKRRTWLLGMGFWPWVTRRQGTKERAWGLELRSDPNGVSTCCAGLGCLP